MRNRAIASLAQGLLALSLAACAVPCFSQVPILLDQDMNADCDDAGALALLHALADRGEAKILGIGSCTSNKYSAAAIEVINTYYGRPDIPVAQIKQPLGFIPSKSSYLEYLATNFPNKLQTAENAAEPVALYREILSKQPDNSVVFVAIGWLPNLRNLLRSGPDRHSAKNGRDLVAQKARMLVDMGPWINPPGKGWNFRSDPASAVEVVRDWPTRIVFSPKEICWAMTGGRLVREAPANNPVRKAYELWMERTKKTSNHSADLTAILYAVRGAANYWIEVRGGHLELQSDAYGEWKPGPPGNQSYLAVKMPLEELAVVLDELLVQPPLRNSRKR